VAPLRLVGHRQVNPDVPILALELAEYFLERMPLALSRSGLYIRGPDPAKGDFLWPVGANDEDAAALQTPPEVEQ